MGPSLWEKVKAWWCRRFGHDLAQTDGNIVCRRCNRLISTRYMRDNCEHAVSTHLTGDIYQCNRCLDVHTRR